MHTETEQRAKAGEEPADEKEKSLLTSSTTKGKVFVAIPVYGGIPPQTVASMIALVTSRKEPMEMKSKVGDSLVSRARNALTADFLASKCDRLLFIDADLIFTPGDFERITSHDEDVVGGFYPIKETGEKIRWCANGPIDSPNAAPDSRGLTEVRYIGTGFMCIRRRVFEQMIESGVAKSYMCDQVPKRTEWDFWSVGIYDYKDGNRRYLSEDWMFCQRCLDLGIKVWGDCAVGLQHMGTIAWPLPHQQVEITEIPAQRSVGSVEARAGQATMETK